MTSSNGNIFRVTGPLCGEFSGPGEFPTQRPVTRSFDVFFDLCLNKRLSKQPWGWWFETPSWSLWRQCNDDGRKRMRGAVSIQRYRLSSIGIPIIKIRWSHDRLTFIMELCIDEMTAFIYKRGSDVFRKIVWAIIVINILLTGGAGIVFSLFSDVNEIWLNQIFCWLVTYKYCPVRSHKIRSHFKYSCTVFGSEDLVHKWLSLFGVRH